jgi:hypothetical protein
MLVWLIGVGFTNPTGTRAALTRCRHAANSMVIIRFTNPTKATPRKQRTQVQ